jgi:UDP-N-acetylmuramate--alanine ligase
VRTINGIELPMPGRHNVQNALAAIGVAAELGIRGRGACQGVRQLQRRQAALHHGGPDRGVTIIDDYGHHPVEIKRSLGRTRGRAGRVIAVVQPHRFTRLGI